MNPHCTHHETTHPDCKACNSPLEPSAAPEVEKILSLEAVAELVDRIKALMQERDRLTRENAEMKQSRNISAMNDAGTNELILEMRRERDALKAENEHLKATLQEFKKEVLVTLELLERRRLDALK